MQRRVVLLLSLLLQLCGVSEASEQDEVASCTESYCSAIQARPCQVADASPLLLPSQGSVADLVHVDLSSQKAWKLTNANNSISLPTTVPAHTLSVLASAGLVAQDPLSRCAANSAQLANACKQLSSSLSTYYNYQSNIFSLGKPCLLQHRLLSVLP